MTLVLVFCRGKVRATPNSESSTSLRSNADSLMSRIAAAYLIAAYSVSVNRVLQSWSRVLRGVDIGGLRRLF